MANWHPILDFWFGDNWADWPPATVSKRWFQSTKQQDADMAAQFGGQVEAALAGDFGHWESTPESRLALVLLLDQLTRNIFRGNARAFAGDERAQSLTVTGIEAGFDRELPWAGQVFFYMPLMHAESEARQLQGLHCFEALHERIPSAHKVSIANNIRFARDHLDVIQQFGRFPYRNAALGRESSPAEQQYLTTANRYGQ